MEYKNLTLPDNAEQLAAMYGPNGDDSPLMGELHLLESYLRNELPPQAPQRCELDRRTVTDIRRRMIELKAEIFRSALLEFTRQACEEQRDICLTISTTRRAAKRRSGSAARGCPTYTCKVNTSVCMIGGTIWQKTEKSESSKRKHLLISARRRTIPDAAPTSRICSGCSSLWRPSGRYTANIPPLCRPRSLTDGYS